MEKYLVENLEIHDTLNPKLWDSNDKLIPDVRDKILEIVEEFKKNVKEMTDLELNPLDIYIVGSNASYNYTSHSDVDVHIVINFDTIDENSGLVQSLMNFQKSSFNSGYDISIHGIDVELYVEDLNSTALSNGVFSVMQDQWIKKPEKIEVEEIDINDDVDEWKEKINAALDSKSADDIGKVIDDLYILRKNSLLSGGEFSEGNLVFKSIRDLELLQDLKDSYTKLRSKELSLENWKKPHKVTEVFSAYIGRYVECPNCGYDTVYIGTVSNDGALVVCDECGTEFEPSLIVNDQGKTELKLLSLEKKGVSKGMKINLTESVNDLWFNSIEREEEAIPDAIQYGVSDSKIDRMISTYDNVVRLLKANRSEVVFTTMYNIDDIVAPDFLRNFKPVKTIQKYNLTLRKDDKGNQIVTEPSYGTMTLYFASEDIAKDIISQYEFDWDNYDDEYTPSSTYGDYSPSDPWNAPGMSKQDFI